MSNVTILTAEDSARRIRRASVDHVTDTLGFILQAEGGIRILLRTLSTVDQADQTLLEKRLLDTEEEQQVREDRALVEKLVKGVERLAGQLAKVRAARVNRLATLERELEHRAEVETPAKAPPAKPKPEAFPALNAPVPTMYHHLRMTPSMLRLAAREIQSSEKVKQSPKPELPDPK
jgi:hypothetical protein